MTITATSIDLSWSPPVGGGPVDVYVVMYRDAGSGAFAPLVELVGTTSYSVTGLVPTTSYDFMVYAQNGAGPGQACVVTQATLGLVPNAPGSFTASAGSPAYSAVNLTWAAPGTDSTHGPAASYQVSYRVNDTGSWTVGPTVWVGTSTTVSGLAHDTLYGFKVDAINSAGVNVSGATTTLTTDYAPPNAPAPPAVTAVPDGTTSKLTVIWSAPATDGTHDAATGYNLRYSVHAADTWTTLTAVSSGAVITGLASGTSYDVQVQGTNGSTTSPGAWSSSGTASTYSSTVAWGISGAPQSSFVHGSGNVNGVSSAGMNADFSINPPGVDFAMAASNTTIPVTGLQSVSYAGPAYQWAAYYPVPSPPGTYYFWAFATDGSGALVSSVITVT